jgi:hypothetical protein
MAAKLTRLAHKIAIQLHLVAESHTICGFRYRRPVRKLFDSLSYTCLEESAHDKFIRQPKVPSFL